MLILIFISIPYNKKQRGGKSEGKQAGTQVSASYENFETFLSTLEEKHGFRLKDCQWTTTETLQAYRYENGREI